MSTTSVLQLDSERFASPLAIEAMCDLYDERGYFNMPRSAAEVQTIVSTWCDEYAGLWITEAALHAFLDEISHGLRCKSCAASEHMTNSGLCEDCEING